MAFLFFFFSDCITDALPTDETHPARQMKLVFLSFRQHRLSL